MPFSRLDRKAALLRIGKSNKDIADVCGVDHTLVSHVLAGRRWTSTAARKVMAYVAELLGAPVGEVFPGHERRHGGHGGRRTGDSAPESKAA